MTPTIGRRTFLFLTAQWGLGESGWAQEGTGRLDRNNLLVYRDESGRVRPVNTVRDWLRRRADILLGMQEVMGPLPGREKRCPLDLQVEDEVDAGSYLRRFITYAAEPGGRVPVIC